jgi:V/A-type H+-transporting ATPase subunit D
MEVEMALRPPPGRAGRLWLAERLEIARRGAGLLERKREALRRELGRIDELTRRTHAAWTETCREAETWMARTLVLGGRAAVRRAAAGVGSAEAELAWRTEMGVTYPGVAVCTLPGPAELAGPAALAPAANAYRHALEAGVQHAAACAARDRLRSELEATRRRLRAIRATWIPRLEAVLYRVELALEEAEREEIGRTRWAREERR